MTQSAAAPRQASRAVAVLAIATLLAALGVSVATVALPTLVAAFAAPSSQVQWVILAYLLSITVVTLAAGAISDRVGHRAVFLAGLGLYAAASAVCAAAPTLGALVAARALQGVGGAILLALPVALMRDTVAAERTGSAMGLLGTMSAIGTALGPSLGGLLITWAGWRASFLVLALLGTATFAAALFAFGQPARAAAPAAAAPKAGGAVRLAAALSPVLLSNLLVSAVMMSVLVVGPFFLSFALGLDQWQVGLVMAVGPAVAALSGVPAGRLTDRFGAHRVVIAGLVQTAAGLLCLALLPLHLGTLGYVLSLAALTPGFQLFLAANSAGVMLAAPANQRGTTSGLLGLSRNLGLMAGASVMGEVFAQAAGTRDLLSASVAAISTGFSATFLFAALLALASLALTALAGRRLRARPSEPA